MAKVEIFTIPTCPYCKLAKDLLKGKNIQYLETDVSGSPLARQKVAKLANGSSKVPQIFINDRHVGGCDDIYKLDAEGLLDSLLKNEK